MDARLHERFLAHLGESGLLEGPGLALLAVSGGPDSMVLLDLLAGAAASRRLTLLIGHADHGIHPHSGEVAEQVRRVALDRYGIATVVERLALGAEAGETQAREQRYAFLRRLQSERQARWLVTAHHADDQAETVLLRLLRGSATVGLAGMAPHAPGGLVRPLLPFGRAELASHARAADLPVFDDPANADPRHTRSWIRTRLLPQLEERSVGGARESLLSVARHAASDIAAWDAALDALPALALRVSGDRFDVARAALGGYDSVLAARLLRAAARRAGLMLGPAQAERIAGFAGGAASGRRLELGEGLVAEAAFDRLIVSRATDAPSAASISGESGLLGFGSFAVTWRTEPAPDRLTRDGWSTWIAAGVLEVRLPAPGDRIVPLGGVGRRSVARLLMEGRVPRADRARWPVIARGGEPIWIPGVCRGQPALPEPGALSVRLDIAQAG